MDYLLCDLWDIVVIEVLRTTKDDSQPGHISSGKFGQIQPNHTSSRKLEYVQPIWTVCDSKTSTQHVNRKQGVEQLSEVEHVPTNTRSSQGEAVIKIIIQGRGPTMRHVSRTHRVAVDWSFDWTNLEPRIQIKHVDTKTNLRTS